MQDDSLIHVHRTAYKRRKELYSRRNITNWISERYDFFLTDRISVSSQGSFICPTDDEGLRTSNSESQQDNNDMIVDNDSNLLVTADH